MNERQVIVERAATTVYPREAPFHPGHEHPEYAFEGFAATEPNPIYDAVRATFRRADLDAPGFGSPQWNPLGDLIRTGETVLLKPNLVKESHPRDPGGWRYVLTHGSVIRAVADYIWKAVGEGGKVIVADAPQTDSSFTAIVRVLGLDTIRDFYLGRGLRFELVDLRQEEWVNQDGVIVDRRKLSGDPYGNVAFDLGQASEFAEHGGSGRYYGADYDAGEVNRHHSGGRHEYLIAGCAIESDVVFSLPKLKTHKKAGITLALKNLIGVNGDKNWLPHHTEGDPSAGGDERPSLPPSGRLERRLAASFRRLSRAAPGIGNLVHRRARRLGLRIFGATDSVVRSGNWWGNDTLWRMCLDLNKLMLYGNEDGTLRPAAPGERRRHFVLVDGVIAGEGRGPLDPDPVEAGIVVFGLHPASVDAACACLVGFDPERIPIVREAFRCERYPIAEWSWRDVELVGDADEWSGRLSDLPASATLGFEPHFGWKGQIERAEAPSELVKP